MDTRTKTINDPLDLLGEHLRPHINKVFMTKELLCSPDNDFAYGDLDRFKSGLYNLMDDATRAYDLVCEKIEQLIDNEPATAN